MESQCLLYLVNGKSLQHKANHYMHSVSFYHLLAMIYTVCFTTYYIPEHSVLCNILLLIIYLSIQYCAI